MKLQYLTPTLHQIHMVIICSVNSFIWLLSTYFQMRQREVIFYAIILPISLFCIGIFTVHTEIRKDRPSSNRFSIVLEYLACFYLSGMAIYFLARIECFIGIVILSIAIPVEAAVIPIISYRYKIRNKILAYLKKRKQKSRKKSN